MEAPCIPGCFPRLVVNPGSSSFHPKIDFILNPQNPLYCFPVFRHNGKERECKETNPYAGV